jgi:hypothetical protein
MSVWNPFNNYVQSGQKDGQFVNGQMVKIAAGPPRLTSFGGALAASALLEYTDPDNLVYPIGFVQNIGISQNKQWTRVNEIGSDRAYFISGRSAGSLNLSSIYYHGPSLLRRMYAYYQDGLGSVTVEPLFENMAAYNMTNPHDVVVPPGYENLYLNLQSDLFSQPVGLLYYINDINQDTVGANYFESVVVQGHNTGTDANGTIMSEQIGMQYERMVPVAVTALDVVKGLALGDE